MLRNVVKKNSYYDSATLMLLSTQILDQIQGVEHVAVMMATDMNKSLMDATELLTDIGSEASPNDLIFAFVAKDDETVENAMSFADSILANKSAKMDDEEEQVVRSVDTAIRQFPQSNMAVVSIPGQYATREVAKLLNASKDVLLFSDNVSIEDEVKLKDLALAKGRLMMGPDCGTAIISGVGLGFANSVRSGSIGLVAASGTGLQEVVTLIHKYGGGISDAYGTGGRDIKEVVGGKMMLECIDRLAKDDQTEVIVIVSKPPSKLVLDKVINRLQTVSKPVITCFLGEKRIDHLPDHMKQAHTLEEAAQLAMGLAKDESLDETFILSAKSKLQSSQKFIRGLYAGGTLAYEALVIMKDSFDSVYSNTPLTKDEKLESSKLSQKHTIIDLGDDEFTRGKPHPMIDPTLRRDRFLQEAADTSVAVILLDVELGYGSHENPAQLVANQVIEAKNIAKSSNRELVFIGSICGTSSDYQDFDKQMNLLVNAGVYVTTSNAQAVRLACEIVKELGGKDE